jgi:predicted transporter
LRLTIGADMAATLMTGTLGLRLFALHPLARALLFFVQTRARRFALVILLLLAVLLVVALVAYERHLLPL